MIRKALAVALIGVTVAMGVFAPAAWAGDRGRDAAKGVLLGVGAGLILGALLGEAEATAAPPPQVVYPPPPVVYAPSPPVVYYVPPPVVYGPPQPPVVYVPAPPVVYGATAGVYVREGYHPRHGKRPHTWGRRDRGYEPGGYAGMPAGHLPSPEYRRGYLNVPPGHLPPREYRY